MTEVGHYVRLMGRNWKILAVTTLIACAAAVAVTVALPKTYQSEARLLVAEPNDSVNIFGTSLPELSAQADNNVATQAELLRSRTLLEAVIRRLGLNDTSDSLTRRVKIAPVGQTAVISIVAKDSSPQTAADVANTLADEYLGRFRQLKHASLQNAVNAVTAEVNGVQAELQKMDAAAAAQGMTASQQTDRQGAAERLSSLQSKLEELKVNMQVEEGWGTVTDQAVGDPLHPIGPTPVSSGVVGLLAGLLFGCVYVLFADGRAHAGASTQPFPLEAATLLIPSVGLAEAPQDSGTKKQKQLV